MEVLWGYTIDRLDHLAKLVVTINASWWGAGDRRDQYETAWMGLVEHLCAATDQPTDQDLLTAGRNALARETNDQQRHRGYRRETGHNSGDGRRFAAYWEWHARPTPSPEAVVVDRIALYQVWEMLTPSQREVFTSLAVTDDHRAAAALTGRSYAAYVQLLCTGRRRWNQWWYEGETPPRHRHWDRRVRQR